MAKYPELEGAPSKCLNTSPMTIDALKIRAPFGKVDKAEILQPAIVSTDWAAVDGVSAWDLFTKFWQKKSQDPGGVGWQLGAELKALSKLLKLANNLIDKKDRYEDNSRAKIVSLAQAAKAQLNFIANQYAIWDGKGFPGKSPYGIQSLSLYRTENEIKARLDPDYEAGAIWPSQRRDARKQIRKAWDKALRFLWCAVYAANQSKAYLKNKEEWDKDGGGIPPKLTPKLAPKKSKFTTTLKMAPVTQEPDFDPGMPIPEDEEIIEEEIVEEKPKKKKGMGLMIVGAAAVALLAMKK